MQCIHKLPKIFAFIVTCLLSLSASAQDKDHKKIIEEDFWGKLYSNGGNTFYCQKTFAKKTPLLAESYVYSTSWMKDHLQCGTSRRCKRESTEYRRMISDLHNIVPADAYFDFKRKEAVFGTVNESVKANDCGIRKAFQTIEPSEATKGDIARIILYMHKTYGLPFKLLLNELKLWNESDPPSAEEIKRNQRIKEIQGTSNPFVEDPSLINSLSN